MPPKPSGANFTCEGCGIVVFCSPSVSVKKRFCSRECQKKHSRELVECRNCGKQFVSVKSKNASFCSSKCSNEFFTGLNHVRWRPEEEKVCLFCGNIFKAKRNWERKKSYCSYECCVADREKVGWPRSVAIGEKEVWGDGYVYVKTENGWVAEHKLVAEKMIGRVLNPNEIVHHKNGNTVNNSEGNLLVVTRKEHMEIHARAELIGLQIMAAENYRFDVSGLGC
jgi:hypothetical protein